MQSTEETRERAKVIYDYLTQHPDKHNQAHYGMEKSCGTTMCIAGYALTTFQPELVKWVNDNGVKVVSGETSDDRDIDVVAAELLGLDSYEMESLFHDMSNTRALEKLKLVSEGEEFETDDDYSCNCEHCI